MQVPTVESNGAACVEAAHEVEARTGPKQKMEGLGSTGSTPGLGAADSLSSAPQGV